MNNPNQNTKKKEKPFDKKTLTEQYGSYQEENNEAKLEALNNSFRSKSSNQMKEDARIKKLQEKTKKNEKIPYTDLYDVSTDPRRIDVKYFNGRSHSV